MFVYTPGTPSRPQRGHPKLVMPAKYHTPPTASISGPPESPWHVSSSRMPPAHIWPNPTPTPLGTWNSFLHRSLLNARRLICFSWYDIPVAIREEGIFDQHNIVHVYARVNAILGMLHKAGDVVILPADRKFLLLL
uniref:Uncharacterized protein n=1 Tax=Anopheles coluzzii TaxID=1518534 RepID=A0A8W7P8Y6_ANOCL